MTDKFADMAIGYSVNFMGFKKKCLADKKGIQQADGTPQNFTSREGGTKLYMTINMYLHI